MITADLPPHERRPGPIPQDLRRHGAHRHREKPLRGLRARQQRLHLPAQRLVAFARSRHERGPLARLSVERRVAHFVYTPSALGVRHRASPPNSRNNQSFAGRFDRVPRYSKLGRSAQKSRGNSASGEPRKPDDDRIGGLRDRVCRSVEIVGDDGKDHRFAVGRLQ